MDISEYCSGLGAILSEVKVGTEPWDLIANLETVITQAITALSQDYIVQNGVAIHTAASVDPTAHIQGPAIIGPGCRIGQNALLRGGIYLTDSVNIGPGCELRACIVSNNSSLSHFNYVGDSIIGANVNLEAGANIVNYFNERPNKVISVRANSETIETGVTKLGAIIGDGSKIGANAVTSPGTVLPINSVVKRLELVEQLPE